MTNCYNLYHQTKMSSLKVVQKDGRWCGMCLKMWYVPQKFKNGIAEHKIILKASTNVILFIELF